MLIQDDALIQLRRECEMRPALSRGDRDSIDRELGGERVNTFDRVTSVPYSNITTSIIIFINVIYACVTQSMHGDRLAGFCREACSTHSCCQYC